MSRTDGMTNVLWLQGASCGGCTMSILESGASGWFDELRQFGINLLWHPSVSARGELSRRQKFFARTIRMGCGIAHRNSPRPLLYFGGL